MGQVACEWGEKVRGRITGLLCRMVVVVVLVAFRQILGGRGGSVRRGGWWGVRLKGEAHA